MPQATYAPYADENPWRVDTFMNVDEWKEVSRWYPFSLRSLMPDGRWYEYSRSKMRDDAYQIMKALAATRPRDYFVIVQCTLVGKAGREKAVVCFPGSETSLLQERQRRIKSGGTTTPTAERQTTEALVKKPLETTAVEKRLKAVIMEAIECGEKDIVYSASLVEDLGSDTFGLLNFVMLMEEEFKIRITGEEADRMLTVGDTLNFLYDKGITDLGRRK